MSIQFDSEGNPPNFIKGDIIYCKPANMQATVIRQILHYDMGETFWGNLELEFDDGIKGTANCWQCELIGKE